VVGALHFHESTRRGRVLRPLQVLVSRFSWRSFTDGMLRRVVAIETFHGVLPEQNVMFPSLLIEYVQSESGVPKNKERASQQRRCSNLAGCACSHSEQLDNDR
jgi:hypothetical protein